MLDWIDIPLKAILKEIYRKRWYLANVKLDMFISILYVNIANLKSVPIEIFAEILNVFMIVRNIRQNSDVFYIPSRVFHGHILGGLFCSPFLQNICLDQYAPPLLERYLNP